MPKPPFFPFYPADWLASPDTAQMTLEEQGAYLNLLCHQWGSPDCALPMDNAVLGYLSRAGDRWAEIGPKILRLCFEKRGKLVFNRRLRREREKYDGKVEAGREGGIRSGRSRRKRAEAKTKVPSISLEAKTNQSEVRSQKSEVRNELTEIIDRAKAVFEHWQRVLGHERSPFTPERRTKIEARLREGSTVEQLMEAIDGCRRSPFHMGVNDGGTVFDSIGLIFRNAEKVEFFRAKLTEQPPVVTGQGSVGDRTVAAMRAFTEGESGYHEGGVLDGTRQIGSGSTSDVGRSDTDRLPRGDGRGSGA